MAEPITFTLAKQLGECANDSLVATSAGAPGRQCTLTAGSIVWDDCQCGQLSVTVPRIYNSQRFPVETVEDGNASACGLPYLVMDVLISVLRCAPAIAPKALAPTCDNMLGAALIWHEDAQAVRRALGCCLRDMTEMDDILSFTLGPTVAVGESGGCVGFEITVKVGLPNCLCPPGP